MRPEERFSKTLFGLLLILAFFVSWGKWAVLGLGFLFLISAAWGICWTCEWKKFWGKKRKITITRRKS